MMMNLSQSLDEDFGVLLGFYSFFFCDINLSGSLKRCLCFLFFIFEVI